VIPVPELLRRLDASRARFLAVVEFVPEARFTLPPLSGVWSIAHVVEHVARVDEALEAGARRVVSGPFGPPLRWSDHLRQLPYRFRWVDQVRVRTRASFDPQEVAPRAESLARLAATRAALRAFLAEHDGGDLTRWTLPHPFFGRMTVDEMCAMAAWHEERHARQADAIAASLPR
jgi:hypothetical protein